MNTLTTILSAAIRKLNKAQDLKLKKIAEYGDASKGAGIYRDVEWQEWRVVFVKDGADLPDADYHAEDKEDAIRVAEFWLMAQPVVAEDKVPDEIQEEMPAPAARKQPSKLMSALLQRI